MPKVSGPDLTKYMDKRLVVDLNHNRKVEGILRGFDQFMNIVLENSQELRGDSRTEIGMVVVRGNSIVTMISLDKV